MSKFTNIEADIALVANKVMKDRTTLPYTDESKEVYGALVRIRQHIVKIEGIMTERGKELDTIRRAFQIIKEEIK